MQKDNKTEIVDKPLVLKGVKSLTVKPDGELFVEFLTPTGNQVVGISPRQNAYKVLSTLLKGKHE